jgi:hypothetical protein
MLFKKRNFIQLETSIVELFSLDLDIEERDLLERIVETLLFWKSLITKDSEKDIIQSIQMVKEKHTELQILREKVSRYEKQLGL